MLVHTADAIHTVTFDRADRLNALRAVDFLEAADAVRDAPVGTRVVVLGGRGRAFCSGADVSGGADLAHAGGETIDAANRLVAAVVASPIPVVAKARGVVAGAGVPIALAADLVLCDHDTFLMLAFTRIGLMPDAGATAIVAAAIGRARAMRLALLAERLPAVDALAAGLVSHVFDVATYEEEADALVRSVADGPTAAFAQTKRAINAATLSSLPSAFELEHAAQVGLLHAPDFAEGSAAFAERRPARFSDLPAPLEESS